MLRRLVHMHYRWLELSGAISEARILPHGGGDHVLLKSA